MKKKIFVVLKENVSHLGERGETKTVAMGYFKNYLLPRGLVVPVGTREARELVEQRQRQASRGHEARVEEHPGAGLKTRGERRRTKRVSSPKAVRRRTKPRVK